jgi:CRISPR/Cas system-associated endoribonuclease Cas2
LSLKENISHYLLSKSQTNSIKKCFLNWSDLKNICIVIYHFQQNDIKEFISACESNNIKYTVVIIYDGKIENMPKAQLNQIILNKKQFSFFNIPAQSALQSINQVFDVIINLGNDTQFSSFAISKLLSAKCRVGMYENKVFDIIIKTEINLGIKEYLKQVIVYLKMIKTTIN